MSDTKTSSSTKGEIQWDTVESLITEGKARLQQLAKATGRKSDALKKLMVEKYGTRIEFKRGRHGGIYWAKSGE